MSRLFLLLLLTIAWTASAAPALVILVRHAEKASAPEKDPPLTAAGRERAEELARVLSAWTAAGGKITALFATDFQRTQQTLAPVSASTHVSITAVKDTPVLIQKIRAVHGGIAVVAGHSNTIPEIIHLLGGPPGIEIEDADNSRLFALTAPGTSHVKVIEVRYGK
jgi:phosphohistidine phosphatase SixA